MGRKKKKGTPEWKRRYNAENPTISMVGTPFRKKMLDMLRTQIIAGEELSDGQLFEKFMNEKLEPAEIFAKELELAKNTISTKDRIIDKISANIEKYRIAFPCEACGYLEALTSDKKEILKYLEEQLKKKYYWLHEGCEKK